MITNETLYRTYVNAHKDNLDTPAIYTRDGKMITHRHLLEEIDRAAAGLSEYRTTDSFRIGIISASSYEEAVFLFAASKIGATTKFIDFSKNISEIIESVTESAINVLAMGAEFLPMEPLINPSALPVIVLGGSSSERPNYCSYEEFINKVCICSIRPAEYKENFCALIINSSGTTGAPKPIELSDRAINTAVLKHVRSDLPLSSQNVMLKIIPSHLGMGSISTLYTCLITDTCLVYFPCSTAQESIEGVLKAIFSFPIFAVNNKLASDAKLLLFAAPMYYRELYQQLDKIEDLSYVGCMLAGGSAMSKEELEVIDAAFAQKGCLVPVLNGYGQNEMAGGVTMNENGANKRGSAGRPMANTEIRVVDLTTGKTAQNNALGKILERSESLFIGYENMPERTKSSFVTDEDGNIWFDTTDVGYIDDEGFLYITGRASRIIIRFDQKASLDKMESKIRMSKYVKEIGVISMKNTPYDSAVAFTVLNDEYSDGNVTPEMILEDVQSSNNYLTDLEKIDTLFIVDSLPYLSSVKIDYRALENKAMGETINAV